MKVQTKDYLDLIKTIFSNLRNNPLISLLFLFLFILESLYARFFLNNPNSPTQVAVLHWTIWLIGITFLYYTFNKFVLLTSQKKVSSFSDLNFNLKEMLIYTWVGFATTIRILAGFILLIVPGIYFALEFAFTGQAVLDKKFNRHKAFEYSSKLTEGRKLFMLPIFFVVNIIPFVLSFTPPENSLINVVQVLNLLLAFYSPFIYTQLYLNFKKHVSKS